MIDVVCRAPETQCSACEAENRASSSTEYNTVSETRLSPTLLPPSRCARPPSPPKVLVYCRRSTRTLVYFCMTEGEGRDITLCTVEVNIWERADPSDAGTVRFKLGDGGTLTSINQVDAITASDVLRTVHLTFPVCCPTRLSGAPSASDWETPAPSNLSCNLGKNPAGRLLEIISKVGLWPVFSYEASGRLPPRELQAARLNRKLM
ncbi:unnamed protein product [Gadus morhua 'NCC']